MAELPEIHWPERYLPEMSHVHASNELTMDAPPETSGHGWSALPSGLRGTPTQSR